MALDVDSFKKAKKLVCELISGVRFFKIGLEVISSGFAP